MKKIHILQVGFAILILCSSFLIKSVQPDSIDVGNKSATAIKYDPLLYNLYIDNTVDHPVFENLIKRAYGTDAGHNKNIVLQFFHKANGKLTLSAYVGKKNRSDFDDVKEFKLKPFKCDGQTLKSIDGKEVFLGDLEINNQDGLLATLLANAADHVNHAYVVFIPDFTTVGTGMNPKPVIQYTAYMVKDTLDVCDPNKLTLPPPSFQTNPSPPKNGN